jgi:uncharacterized protein with GYD domain
MAQFSYTSQAWAAFAKKPEDRTEPVSALAQKLGCRLVDLSYHFGEYDGFVILEAPDDSTALSFAIAAHAPGHLKATKTTRLFTTKEAVEAMRKAGTGTLPAPGATR